MYPRPPLTTVHVAGLTDDLCGAARPDALRRRHDGRRQAVLDRRTVLARTSAARTRSNSPSSRAWPPTSIFRSRSSAARSCASPTDSRCRAATRTSRADERAAAPVLVRRCAAPRRSVDRRRARSAAVSRHRPRRSSRPSRASSSSTSRSATPTSSRPIDALEGTVLLALAARRRRHPAHRQRRHHDRRDERHASISGCAGLRMTADPRPSP